MATGTRPIVRLPSQPAYTSESQPSRRSTVSELPPKPAFTPEFTPGTRPTVSGLPPKPAPKPAFEAGLKARRRARVRLPTLSAYTPHYKHGRRQTVSEVPSNSALTSESKPDPNVPSFFPNSAKARELIKATLDERASNATSTPNREELDQLVSTAVDEVNLMSINSFVSDANLTNVLQALYSVLHAIDADLARQTVFINMVLNKFEIYTTEKGARRWEADGYDYEC